MFELRRRLDRFLDVAAQSSELMKLLGEYQTLFAAVPEAAASILESSKPEEFQAEAGKMRSALIGGVREVRSISPREVFSLLESFDSALEEMNAGNEHFSTFCTEMTSTVQAFSDSYDEFLREYSNLPTLRMLQLADDLKRRIEVGRLSIQSLLKELSYPEIEPDDGWGLLTLVLHADLDLGHLVLKLRAVDVLYSECCLLLGKSELDYPARVSKVETGSLVVQILGNTEVVTFLSRLISAAGNFLISRFTQLGRIESLPRKTAAIEEILQLSERLKTHGVDTARIDEQIEKSTFQIAQELNELLKGEPRVEVDGEIISIADEQRSKYLEEAKLKALRPASNSCDRKGQEE